MLQPATLRTPCALYASKRPPPLREAVSGTNRRRWHPAGIRPATLRLAGSPAAAAGSGCRVWNAMRSPHLPWASAVRPYSHCCPPGSRRLRRGGGEDSGRLAETFRFTLVIGAPAVSTATLSLTRPGQSLRLRCTEHRPPFFALKTRPLSCALRRSLVHMASPLPPTADEQDNPWPDSTAAELSAAQPEADMQPDILPSLLLLPPPLPRPQMPSPGPLGPTGALHVCPSRPGRPAPGRCSRPAANWSPALRPHRCLPPFRSVSSVASPCLRTRASLRGCCCYVLLHRDGRHEKNRVAGRRERARMRGRQPASGRGGAALWHSLSARPWTHPAAIYLPAPYLGWHWPRCCCIDCRRSRGPVRSCLAKPRRPTTSALDNRTKTTRRSDAACPRSLCPRLT